MKRCISVLLLVFMLCIVIVSTCVADTKREFTSGKFVYVIEDDGTATIVGYKAKAASVTVPETLNNKTVTGIGEDAFDWCRELCSVTIPKTVVRIDSEAFGPSRKLEKIEVSPNNPAFAAIDGVLFRKADKCLMKYPNASKNTKYTIPDGIAAIGDKAFFGSDNLETVIIPDTVTSIGEQAFVWCGGLKTIDIPRNVTEIKEETFKYCHALQKVTLPEGLKTIGDEAFCLCDALQSFTIPSSVTTIGDEAFYHCDGVKTMAIPDGVTRIGDNPFAYCENLTEIKVSKQHPLLEVVDGVLFRKTDKCLVTYPCALKAAKYSVPNGTQSIGERAFIECNNLRDVVLPDSVTAIGEMAFYWCVDLQTISLSGGLKSIDERAFVLCKSLQTITLPKGMTTIGDGAFDSCKQLQTINLPSSVNSIGEKAFDACDNLTLSVAEGSYAANYAEKNKLRFAYPNALDWLNQ